MASSSSAAFPSKKYHVFISFRGEDTRKNFTSHLHDALCRNNIETFIDYRLEKGAEVWPSLEKAIHDSAMFLIVFSENFATSTWCLEELTTILECSKEKGLSVIPVFYEIDPSDIRKQKGSYEIAFRNHERSNPKQQVQKWRKALTHAADLSGWHCSTYRNEAEIIQQIVKCVLKKLDPAYQDICFEGLVGVEEKVEAVELLMHNSSSDVRFIGVWGMPGIGKTTIVKALFNKLCFSFDSFCFLANVREEYENSGIEHVKYKLLSTLLEDEKSYKGMPDGGSTYVGMRLRQKKFLVVLDDINNLKQLESLAGAHHWFGPGSRIIITTRDKEALGPLVDHVYEMKLLMPHQALQLFKLKAFKDNCCDEEFECLSLKVVNYAKGLPLALTVLGCSLCGKNKNVWESQLEKLRKMPHKGIQPILRLSYEGLDREEKDILLFIACFFKRRSIEHIENILDAAGFSTTTGLRSLQDNALLSIFKGYVMMHYLIKEMGMEIVREESLEDPGKRSRLWDANDICQILKDNKGSEAIKSITLDMSKVEDLCLSPQAFSKMPNLLFLEIYNSGSSKKHDVYLPQGLQYLPNKLRYLGWDNFPSKSLPLTFSAENLVELRMPYSRMTKLWHGVQNVVNLKQMVLCNSAHLVELPDFSKANNLESVDLSNCASIRGIHPSVLSLNKMKFLRLDDCVALSSLKSDNELKSLLSLSARGCSSLKEFSIIAENIISLHLEMTAIEAVPSCIGRMPMLGNIYLSQGKCMRHYVEAIITVFNYRKKAILANAIFRRNKSPSHKQYLSLYWIDYAVKYPGDRVPEWLKYKTTHPSILVDLSSAPLSLNWSLLCCIVAPPPPSSRDAHVRCRCQILLAKYVLAMWETNFRYFGGDTTSNNHVYLWFDDIVCQRIHQIKEGRANSNNSKILLNVEFDCFVYNEKNQWEEDEEKKLKLPIEVKEYGACPTYSWECQNFLNEMGLVSQASTSRAGARCSSHNQDDESDSSSNYFSFEDSDDDTSISSTFQPRKKPKWS